MMNNAPRNKTSPPVLAIAHRLFAELEERRVRYCHWKSNQHLDAALAGRTDIDILVAREDAALFVSIITSLGFKRFLSPSWKTYAEIEDYLGFDEKSGALFHLHVHYALMVGRQYVKAHHIPWEKLILDTAVYYEGAQVKIIDPHLELLLLWIRSAVKLRLKDLLKALKNGPAIDKAVRLEFRYLEDRVTPDRMRSHMVDLLGPKGAQRLWPIMARKNGADLPGLIRYRLGLRGVADQWRIYSAPGEVARAYGKFLQKTACRLAASVLGLPIGMSKRASHGGALVAFIGPDGSGKSTVATHLEDWLSWKIDTHRLYFGSGDGSVNLIFRMRKRLKQLLVSIGVLKDRPHKEGEAKPRRTSWLKDLFDGVTLLSLARDKLANLKKARRLTALGSVVIADRYPQNEVRHINDGPKIGLGDQDSWIRQYFSRKELALYRTMARLPADLIVKLMVSVEVALARKPDHQRGEIERKVGIVRDLRFEGSRIVAVDADQPLEQVLLEAKRAVWEAL
ncbi:MAG: hypothetical protein ABFD81_10415 [Syntrophaceae bacterium]